MQFGIAAFLVLANNLPTVIGLSERQSSDRSSQRMSLFAGEPSIDSEETEILSLYDLEMKRTQLLT
jgi:hypothetical protein